MSSTEPVKHQSFALDCLSVSLHRVTHSKLEESLIQVLSKPESVDIQWNMVGGIISLIYLLQIRTKMLNSEKPLIRRKLEREKLAAELKNKYLDIYRKVHNIKNSRGEILAPMEDLNKIDLVPLFQASAEKRFGALILECWSVADSLDVTCSNDVYHVRQPDIMMDYSDLGGTTGKRTHDDFFLATPTTDDPDEFECLIEEEYLVPLKKPTQ